MKFLSDQAKAGQSPTLIALPDEGADLELGETGSLQLETEYVPSFMTDNGQNN